MLGNIPKMKKFCKKKNLFMNKEALALRNKKNKQWKKYKRTKDHRDHDLFKVHRNKLSDMTRQLRKDLESSLIKNIKTKPKLFWKYVRSRLVARSDIPTLSKPNNEKAITTQQKAETLNAYFSSVFTEEDESNIPDVTTRNYNDAPLTSIEFTEESIKSKLLKMDENKSPGPDQIHPVFAKRLAHVLSRPLAILFNLSVNLGTTAKQWKDAILTAIYKNGERNLPKNYRPISLTSIISKLIESFIRDAMLAHMVKYKLYTKE